MRRRACAYCPKSSKSKGRGRVSPANLKTEVGPCLRLRWLLFSDGAESAGGRVLIHCQAGVSRSSTLAIAYVMARSHLAMLDAFRYVKSRRSIVAPNFNFMGQLLEFETALKLNPPRGSLRQPRHDVVEFIARWQLNDPTAASDPLDIASD